MCSPITQRGVEQQYNTPFGPESPLPGCFQQDAELVLSPLNSNAGGGDAKERTLHQKQPTPHLGETSSVWRWDSRVTVNLRTRHSGYKISRESSHKARRTLAYFSIKSSAHMIYPPFHLPSPQCSLGPSPQSSHSFLQIL